MQRTEPLMREPLDNEMTTKRIVLRVIRFFWLCLLAFVGAVVLLVLLIPRETHSLRKYRGLRAKRDQDLMAHFPQTIPESASLKKFLYSPCFGPGGPSIQLRLALPPNEIEKLYTRFAKEHIKSFFGGDWNSHVNQKDDMPTIFFRTGEADQMSFPDDYEIMILDVTIPEKDRDSLNHGQSRGVAISKRRNEIIYWAKSW